MPYLKSISGVDSREMDAFTTLLGIFDSIMRLRNNLESQMSWMIWLLSLLYAFYRLDKMFWFSGRQLVSCTSFNAFLLLGPLLAIPIHHQLSPVFLVCPLLLYYKKGLTKTQKKIICFKNHCNKYYLFTVLNSETLENGYHFLQFI